MSSIHTLIDLFITTPSLTNAKKLVAKTIHNPMSMCLITADHAGIVRSAELMVEAEKSRLVAVNKAIAASGRHGRPISGGEARRIHALLAGRH